MKLQAIALGAVRKRFSPEFVNRIDVIVTYQPLDEGALRTILDHQLLELQQHINSRLAERWFEIEVTEKCRLFFLQQGTSAEYGARELKRTVHRHLMQPLATMVAAGEIEPGSRVRVDAEGDSVTIRQTGKATVVELKHPSILLVDDNRDLLRFLEKSMTDAGCRVHLAVTPAEARDAVDRDAFNAIFVDSILLESNGVELAIELHHKVPRAEIVIMTDDDLSAEEQEIASGLDFALLRKPFLPSFALAILNDRMQTTVKSG